MTRYRLSASLLPLLVALGPTAAADDGKALHDQHCVSCHASMTGGKPDSLYTRPDRRVTTAAGLRKQVQRCELSLGLRWFDEDIGRVTDYLNQSYYHFK